MKSKQRRKATKRAVLLNRQGGKCKYCGQGLSKKTATLDHIVPKCAGGTLAYHNLAVACRTCNEKKANKPPHVWHMELMTGEAA